MTVTTIDSAEAAYDALAPAYDLLTSDYDYDTWLTVIERVVRSHGVPGSPSPGHRVRDREELHATARPRL
jgi:hypothetical protein